MRRWSTSSSRRRPERRAAVLALLLLPACVSSSRYEAVREERDGYAQEARQLSESLRRLEASNQSLDAERVSLLEQIEELRIESEALRVDVEKLEGLRRELSASLEAREGALEAGRGELLRLRQTYDALVTELQSEVAEGRIEIEQLREGLRVNLAQEILFPLGSAELSAEGAAVLGKVAHRLRDLPNPVVVEGHTDDLAIGGRLARRYPSNWELGGARAARVVRLLEAQGIAAERLRVVSYGASRPIASNETAEGRARNRRIEIRLEPPEAAEASREARPATEAPDGPAPMAPDAPAPAPDA